MNRTPDEVLTDPTPNLPPGSIVSSVISLFEYVVPGEDDEDERGPFLAWHRDQVSGVWKHLGMVESLANDLRAQLHAEPD